MAKILDGILQEPLQNSELNEGYDALLSEQAIIRAIIEARQQSGLTQKELSERTGIAQGDISKLERGNANGQMRGRMNPRKMHVIATGGGAAKEARRSTSQTHFEVIQ